MYRGHVVDCKRTCLPSSPVARIPPDLFMTDVCYKHRTFHLVVMNKTMVFVFAIQNNKF